MMGLDGFLVEKASDGGGEERKILAKHTGTSQAASDQSSFVRQSADLGSQPVLFRLVNAVDFW